MKLAESRITAQGQVSVPLEVRRRLGLGPGSVLQWELEGNLVFIRRAGRCTSEEIHRALFPEGPARHSLGELEEGIRRNVRKRRASD